LTFILALIFHRLRSVGLKCLLILRDSRPRRNTATWCENVTSAMRRVGVLQRAVDCCRWRTRLKCRLHQETGRKMAEEPPPPKCALCGNPNVVFRSLKNNVRHVRQLGQSAPHTVLKSVTITYQCRNGCGKQFSVTIPA
jgi:hypothetical protein